MLITRKLHFYTRTAKMSSASRASEGEKAMEAELDAQSAAIVYKSGREWEEKGEFQKALDVSSSHS